MAGEPERLGAVLDALQAAGDLTWEMVPGVVVAHVRIAALREMELFLGISPAGVRFPGLADPARLVFVLLTPEERPEEHLSALAQIARLVSDPARLRRMMDAPELEALLAAASGDGAA